MSLRKALKDFSGSIATATSDAPDEYPDWSSWTYETHMSDLQELWATIRPQLKHDLEQVQWVDDTLREMLTAFDTGQKDKGRKAAWALYNADVTKLR